jgi:hypothetical protein
VIGTPQTSALPPASPSQRAPDSRHGPRDTPTGRYESVPDRHIWDGSAHFLIAHSECVRNQC